MKITVILGSIREGRRSERVARLVATTLHDDDVQVELVDLAELDIPVMRRKLSGDAAGDPRGAQLFSDAVAASDAIVVVSPEYNGGYSPALKNAIDYIDPAHFRRKAWGTVTVSNGPMGGMRAAQALQHLALALFAVPCPQMLLVGSVEQKVAEDGTVVDPSMERGLGNFRREFLWLAKALASARS